MKNKHKPPADPEEICRQWIPSQYWDDVMGALWTSIELAHQSRPNTWSIRLALKPPKEACIMLKVGRSEVLQILPPDKHELPFHLIVNKYSVPPELRGRPELLFQYSGPEDCYSSNPGSETCDLPFENVKDVYQALLPAHTEAIDNASGNHPSNQSSHQPELVSFLASTSQLFNLWIGQWWMRSAYPPYFFLVCKIKGYRVLAR